MLPESTPTYNAIFDCKGELLTAVADMSLLEKLIFPKDVASLPKSGPICIDANMSVSHMKEVVKFCASSNRTLIFEPTSVPKACKIFKAIDALENLPWMVTTPNYDECMDMAKSIKKIPTAEMPDSLALENIPQELLFSAHKLLSVFDIAVIKLGSRGVLLGQKMESSAVSWNHHQPEEVAKKVISVTGAGDSMVGSLATALCNKARPTSEELSQIVKACMTASLLSIQSPLAVSDALTSDIFRDLK